MNRILLVALVVIGAAFGALGTWIAERIAPGALSDGDRARIEHTVRDYILANPDIIPEAMQRLNDRENAKVIGTMRSAIETPYGNAYMGNPHGDVTLVEYYDYNCGYCRASLPTLEKLVQADPKLRIVFREMPVLAESSLTAARASITAASQGKFKPFHDALYAGGPVSEQTIAAAARTAGVDLAKAPSDADDEIRNNLATTAKLGMRGTPSWIVGDRVLSGALPIDRLQEAIAAARAARS
ncbi:MAG: DsbA family protein [Candidatus Sphingomonas colombiensis]|nr:DsbA family protein [Sphingomonas sp.]WEK43504.1 MAG: DsbA family protein [Sphingomonas sp.]